MLLKLDMTPEGRGTTQQDTEETHGKHHHHSE